MNALEVPKAAPWGLDAPRRPPPRPVLVPAGPMAGVPNDVVRLPLRPATARRVARVLVTVGLNLGAVIGVAFTGVTLLATRQGIHPLVVQSGSMEPTIPTGSLVLVKRVAASHIRVGDIVTVERADHTRVTHRVMTIEHNGVTALLTLKGDANEDPDPAPVPVQYAYRLVAHVPVVGRAVGWLATAPAGFLLGGFSSLVTRPVRRRRVGASRASVTELSFSRPCACGALQVQAPSPSTPAGSPFLSWVGIVVEERLAQRRSHPASPIEDWTVRHAA